MSNKLISLVALGIGVANLYLLFLNNSKLNTIMATQAQFNDVLNRIDNATNQAADAIRGLREEIRQLLDNAGITGAEEDAVLGRLDTVATNLEGIAADPANPVPNTDGGTTNGGTTTGGPGETGIGG